VQAASACGICIRGVHSSGQPLPVVAVLRCGRSGQCRLTCCRSPALPSANESHSCLRRAPSTGHSHLNVFSADWHFRRCCMLDLLRSFPVQTLEQQCQWSVAWRSRNDVALRRARLVLLWVTVYRQVNRLGTKPAN